MSRFFGVTVLPEYIQFEGVDAVLDRLQDTGVNAVATSPYVMELADEATGSREPPRDAGAGEVRLLDRPLWNGQRELWVRTAPSFPVDRARYADLRYQPPPHDPLTDQAGAIVAEFLRGARRRGLRTYFQIQAAIPPGYRVQFGGPQSQDLPRLPDGRTPQNRVANQASLASAEVIAYQDALIGDLLANYADLDGIRFDWPEYPPYKIDSAFVDFSEHAHRVAEQMNLDWEGMRSAAQSLYDWLHGGLTDEDISTPLANRLRDRPGLQDWAVLKQELSFRLLSGFRRRMDACDRADMELAPSAFPWPWSLASGMNLARAAEVCGSVAVKLYGMHWAMMLHFYGEQLLRANPRLEERKLVRWLARSLDICESPLASLEDYRYPAPDEPHPVSADAQRRKIDQAKSAAGSMPVHVLAHGYGPVDDVAARFHVAWTSAADGIWVNRYGYLSDAKLSRFREIVA